MASSATGQSDCEYVVVGSGAGGGTLAARLAESGRTVVLLEAGGDPRTIAGGNSVDPVANRLCDDYDVPAFHGFASENDAMAWNFFVRHYESDAVQKQDVKYREMSGGARVDGVLYPRAATLGGCTAHNAMILIYPHDADWDGIARLTGDTSWSSGRMRAYFQRLENCHHRRWPPYRWLARIGIDPTRHGWSGWLQTERAIPRSALGDRALRKVMKRAVHEARGQIGDPISRLRWLFQGLFDLNDRRLVADDAVGVGYLPLATRHHARTGARERVLEVARRHPDRLRLELNALATRVLLDRDNRAVGVEYRRGERLYGAHPRPSGEIGEHREVRASREVILAGGAFNTPQLLMLSGIGPREALERHGIPVRVDLPGVGQNLQDRYEVSVVNRMVRPWKALEGARFARGDDLYRQWAERRKGVYSSNGGIVGVVKRSAPERASPDLFLLGLLAKFDGYYPDYSGEIRKRLDHLSWTVLKAHTRNRAGEVTLRSADPRETPAVNFRYFEEGSEEWAEDLDSVIDGIKFARAITARLEEDGLIAHEELPGAHVRSDDQLREFVRFNAWGHHASCTCAIGPREQRGVLGADFRVHGTRGLRVVDASVFPRIPGFFIVSAVYMVAEKAAEVMLDDAALGAQ